jgi:hypothetical protein
MINDRPDPSYHSKAAVLMSQPLKSSYARCVGAAALELHLDVAAHPRRRHVQVLDG